MLTVWSDETDPDTRLAWLDSTGVLRNFTGWTLHAEVVVPSTNAIALNKTTGVTGGNGSGLSNVNISWTGAELAGIAGPTAYRLRVVAVNGAEVAVFSVDNQGTLPRLRVIAKPT
jgi:hypothetical protein